MSKRYPGGLITKTPVTPTTSSAPGVWTLEQALQYIKAGTWPLYVLSDPYFRYVTMLLHGDGTNGAQNNTFLDSSTNNFSITRNGNTTQGSFSPYGSNWSNYFNGSSDYISVPDSVDFTMGSGDFTAQCWVFSTANSGSDQYIFGQVTSSGTPANTSFQLYKKATSNVAEAYVYMGGAKVATSSATIPVGVWTHLAMVRDGGTMRLYVNGVQDGTNATLSTGTVNDSAGSFSVGRTGDYNGLYFAGYVSNVSVVKGTCLFPNGTTFTPSTTPLSTGQSGQSVLLCQANRFVDSNTATTAKTVTSGGTPSVQRFSPFSPTAAYSTSVIGGSGYFDGGSDYLRLASGTTGVNGSAFTICLWFYPLNSSVIGLFDSDPNTVGCFRNYTTNTIEDQNNLTKVNFANTYQVNAWNWMCITKSGTSFTVRINGTSIGTGNCATNMSENEFTVGAINGGGDGSYLGYISDFQILNTSTVVSPPTAPLTNASGKTLLLNFTNGGIFDNAMMNNLETVGNAQISTSVVKFGTGSMAFDGSGDRLTIPYTNDFLDVGVNGQNFTIEAWIYPTNAMASTGQILSKGGGAASWSTSNGAQYQWSINSSALSWQFNSGGSPITVNGGSVTLNSWQHVAVTFDGTTTRTFLNGVVQSTSTSTYTAPTTRNVQYIGMTQSSGFTQEYFGNIDDLRITKGYARYTANFTPPTAAFPNN